MSGMVIPIGEVVVPSGEVDAKNEFQIARAGTLAWAETQALAVAKFYDTLVGNSSMGSQVAASITAGMADKYMVAMLAGVLASREDA